MKEARHLKSTTPNPDAVDPRLVPFLEVIAHALANELLRKEHARDATPKERTDE